jgi:hypothetical protein
MKLIMASSWHRKDSAKGTHFTASSSRSQNLDAVRAIHVGLRVADGPLAQALGDGLLNIKIRLHDLLRSLA